MSMLGVYAMVGLFLLQASFALAQDGGVPSPDSATSSSGGSSSLPPPALPSSKATSSVPSSGVATTSAPRGSSTQVILPAAPLKSETSPSAVASPEEEPGSFAVTKEMVAGAGLAAALAGLGAYQLRARRKSKQGQEDDGSPCFDLKKKVEEKFNELTDIRGKIKSEAEAKARGVVRNALSGSAAGALLERAEAIEAEYQKLKKLLDQCEWESAPKKKQVVVVGGGTTFDTYNEYLSFLRNREVDANYFKSGADWKGALQEALGDDFEVFQPQMPNRTSAHYQEWCIWFERMIPFLYDGVVLVGHSLGGIFLAKYLQEHTLPVRIHATVLIAAPFDGEKLIESLGDFRLPPSLAEFAARGGAIHLFHSEDDQTVPVSQLEKYRSALPNANAHVLKGRGHFNIESFPEFVELVKKL